MTAWLVPAVESRVPSQNTALFVVVKLLAFVPPFATGRMPVRFPTDTDVVPTTMPLLSVPKSAFVIDEKDCDPVVVALTTSVDDAMSCVPLSQSGVVVL